MFVRATFDAHSVSARNCGLVYGLPSPSAWMGFVHAWCLQAHLIDRLVPGVTPIVRQFAINGFHDGFGRVNFALPRCTERDSDRGTQLDAPTAFFSGGVIFELDINEDDKEGTMVSLTQALLFMKFAGGAIVDPELKTFDTLDLARKTIGFTLQEEPIPESEASLLDRLLDHVTPQKGKKGWCMPSLMGYRAIEELASNRPGARGGYRHAYADPLIGVVRAVGLSRTSNIPRWDWYHSPPFVLFKTI